MNMKPWIISGLCCLGAGIILAAAGLAGGALSSARWKTKLELTQITYTPDADFHNVMLDADYADITIQKGDTPSVTAKDAERDKFSAQVKDGVLVVTQKSQQKYWPSFDIIDVNTFAAQITITLPEQVYSAITVHASCGKVAISDVQSRQMQITADCGQVITSGIQADTMDISCALGDLDMTDCMAADTLSVDLDCGEAVLKHIETKNLFTIHNDMGDVECSRMTVGSSALSLSCGSLEMTDYTETAADTDSTLQMDSGDVEMTGCTLYGLYAQLSCGSIEGESIRLGGVNSIYVDLGDIDLTLAGSQEDYLLLSAPSGKEESKPVLCAKADCGDVEIDFRR